MTDRAETVDYEGSYLLGEADGESWAGEAHPNDTQSLSLLTAEDIGQRDIFGQEAADFLQQRAGDYARRDPNFSAYTYFEGFLSAVRRSRHQRAFAVAGRRARW
jgi:hypothetical protein